MSSGYSTSPLYVNAGDELNFAVTIAGFPRPAFEALLNGEPLRRHATIDDFDERAVRVRFAPLVPEHSGELVFRVANDEGEDERRVQLRVLAVPSAPVGLRVSLLTATSVELSWQPPRQVAVMADDNDDESEHQLATTIEYYVIERKTAEQSRWRSAGKLRPTASTPLRFVVDELFRDDIYVFRVYAVSGVGAGAACASVDVITPAADDDDERSASVSLPSDGRAQSLAPDTPAAPPTITMNNRRVELNWESIDSATMYSVERRRESNDISELWLEVSPISEAPVTSIFVQIANTDRCTFIDRSVFTTATYSYRIVARIGRLRSRPSPATRPLLVEAQELRRSASATLVRPPSSITSTTADDRSEASDRPSSVSRSVDDSGIGLGEARIDSSPKKAIIKKKKRPTNDDAAAIKPPLLGVVQPASESNCHFLSLVDSILDDSIGRTTVVRPMQDVEAAIGSTAIFECEFLAHDDDDITIQWRVCKVAFHRRVDFRLKNEELLVAQQTPRFSSSLHGGHGTLKISAIVDADAARYRCELVVAGRVEASSEARLIILVGAMEEINESDS